MNGILLDSNDDLLISDGDFVIGETLDQEVGMIIRMVQGELKSDPVLGAGLFRMINSNATPAQVKRQIKIHLERDGKNYEEIKKGINIRQWQ